MRRAFVVVGCHRSGTSAMARALSLCGAELPEGLQLADAGNPKGHWEPWEVVNFNDDVLAAMGVRWDSLFGTGRAAVLEDEAAHLAAARKIVRKNYRSDTIVFKDPRVSLLLPLWRATLEAEGYSLCPIVMVRHPRDVAESLWVRDRLSRNHGMMLWLTYALSLEAALGDLPRCYVSYAELARDPEAQIDRIEAAFGAGALRRTWTALLEVESFLDCAREYGGDHAAANAAAVLPIIAYYEALLGLARDEPPLRASQDRAQLWWGTQLQLYGPIIEQLEARARAAA